MPRPVKLTPHICDLIALHNLRSSLSEEITPYFDYFVGETTGLHTHLTYSGAVYYGRKALKP